MKDILSEQLMMKKMPCEVYSRVVGYLRPVRNWNLAKRQEFKDRTPYRIKEERDDNNDGHPD